LGRSVGAEYEVAMTLEALARLALAGGRASASDYLAEARFILERLGVVSTPRVPHDEDASASHHPPGAA
jgi:hypothetical protein